IRCERPAVGSFWAGLVRLVSKHAGPGGLRRSKLSAPEMSEKCQKLEGGYGPLSRNPPRVWSGRPDSNRRRPAWEAGILPLNYGRPAPPILRIVERRRYCDSLSDMLKAWMTSSLRAFQLTRLLTP